MYDFILDVKLRHW